MFLQSSSEGSAFRVFKQMQILRRLLAAQNDSSHEFFRKLYQSGAHHAKGRRCIWIRTPPAAITCRYPPRWHNIDMR